ncbi:Oidioi.mRNA.OKI2018_I69.chr2.g5716.t1.cds [Oikopleura dioica]|uniref:Cytosol aminopeptidase n=1 Tax=Oikopleura dioica TaxID=34765 RepID=A0ABN7T4E1_OIKDI|nr:Oidioi.mRNA.OKI2018_I69.chr2.g5716.t1.cds [Oikopleura dioica]
MVEDGTNQTFLELNEKSGSILQKHLDALGGPPKAGQVRQLPSSDDEFDIIAIVGQSNKADPSENRDVNLENVRAAVANGVKALNGLQIEKVQIAVDSEAAQAAGESAKMTAWTYKADKREKIPQKFSVFKKDSLEFDQGLILGEAQNIARELMELPGNLLTPSIFADKCVALLEPLGVKVNVYGADWIKEQNMNAFWSVAKGSSEEPKFVEMIWEPEVKNREETFALVGKGVTFDSGGISIKPSANMGDMRGDMGGAAVTVATMYAAAKLKIPGKVLATTPLAENMPSSNASKPGDVVIARNGKSIQIDNTDAEGRLLLCDALDYTAEVHKPAAMIDSATLTGAMVIALGDGATGVFCKDNDLWNLIEKSGHETGDRAWRMPHYQHYFDAISPTHNADLNNTGGRAAVFPFAEHPHCHFPSSFILLMLF